MKIKNIILIVGITVLLLVLGIKAATTIESNQVSYHDSTVEEKLDDLIEKTNQLVEPITCTPGYYCTTSMECPKDALCSKVSVGDYVKMTSTSTSYTILKSITGYTSDQVINPSELDLWRVISINSDGTIDMISEYVSSTNVHFSGQKGYLNYVGALNLIAKQYENSKYTVGSRHIGFNGQTQVITDISKFTYPASLTSSTSNNSNESAGGGDIMFGKDEELVIKAIGTLVSNKVGTTTAARYLHASRYYDYTHSSHYYWFGRIVIPSGSINNAGLYYYSDKWGDNTDGGPIRPIVTLKAEVKATGAGTSDNPWILS